MKLDELLKKHFNELLTEDASSEIQTMFDVLVEDRVNAEIEVIREETAHDMYEQVVDELREWKGTMIENMNDYIQIAVNDFLLENESVITNNFIGYNAEQIMEGLQFMMSELNMPVPKAKQAKTINALQENLEEITDILNEETNTRIEKQKQIVEYKKALVFQKLTENCTMSEKERILELIESQNFRSVGEMKKTVQTLVENLDIVARETGSSLIKENLDMEFENKDVPSSKENFEIDEFLPKYI